MPILHYSRASWPIILIWAFVPSLKTPCKFWTNRSFSSIICLFFISKLEHLNIMLVICVLYSTAYWNILITFLCSSKFASSPCIDPGVWNLGVSPLELIFEKRKLRCEVQITPNTFVHVAELGIEGSIPSLFYGIRTNCCTYSGFGSKSYICSSIFCWDWMCGKLGTSRCMIVIYRSRKMKERCEVMV